MQYRSPYWLEPAPAPCSTGALIGWSRLLLQLQYRSPYWLEPAPAPCSTGALIGWSRLLLQLQLIEKLS